MLSREESLEFLAAASAAVAESLDYEETLQRIAHSAIPAFADIVIVYVRDDNGELQRQVAAAADPERNAALDTLKKYPPPAERLNRVLTSEKAWVVTELDSTTWDFINNAAHRNLAEKIGIRSLVASPMRSGAQAYGVMFLARTSDTSFSPFEVLIA